MGEVQLTCLSLKERLPFVLTFWLCLIIMKFLVLLFSLLLVLACGFSLVRFFTNSFRSLLPAWKNQKQTIKNKQTKYETRLVHQTSLNALWIMQCMTCAAYFQAFFYYRIKSPNGPAWASTGERDSSSTIAVARRVSLSALGFLWSFSMSLKVSSSPLSE